MWYLYVHALKTMCLTLEEKHPDHSWFKIPCHSLFEVTSPSSSHYNGPLWVPIAPLIGSIIICVWWILAGIETILSCLSPFTTSINQLILLINSSAQLCLILSKGFSIGNFISWQAIKISHLSVNCSLNKVQIWWGVIVHIRHYNQWFRINIMWSYTLLVVLAQTGIHAKYNI